MIPLEPFSVFVRGIIAPKGSKKGFVTTSKTGRQFVNIVDDNPKGLRAWEYAIRHVLQGAWPGPPLAGAVFVGLEFSFLRPPSVSAKKRPYPTVAPDGDKIERACWDALKGIAFRDDAQIVSWTGMKQYGEESGVKITIRPLEASYDLPPLSLPTQEPKALLGDGVDALVSLGMSRQEAQRVKAKDRPALIEALRTAGNNERKV